jgi:hypothetical protein
MVANFKGSGDNTPYEVSISCDMHTKQKKLKNDLRVLMNVREMEIDLDYLKSYILETYENILAVNE